MRESFETFIRNSGNEDACVALGKMNGMSILPTKAFIYGPAKSGKSALIRGLAEDAKANGAEAVVFACSGADIAMALQFEADDSFFERLGSTAVLLIDDIAPLLAVEKGDHLLSLLLEERSRLGLSMAITSRLPINELNAVLSKDGLAEFESIRIDPLDKNGREEYVRKALQEYGSEASPIVEDAAISAIVDALGDDLASLDHAAQYLATDAECAELESIDASTVRSLLHVGEA